MSPGTSATFPAKARNPATTANDPLNGYAGAAMSFGFGALGLGEIVSFTAAGNTRSQRVMHRLGMTHDRAEDFDHPAVDGPLRRHVLFRISDEHWQQVSGRTSAGPSI